MSTRRRPALWPLALLAALLIGGPAVAGILTLLDGGEPGPIELGPPPDAYRIVYRVEDLAGDEVSVSTRRLSIRRPFDGRIEDLRGAPPGGELVALTAYRFGRLQTGAPGPDALVVVVEPSPPEPDLRLDATLAAALEQGIVEWTGRRDEVLGRPCDLYRTRVAAPGSEPTDEVRELCVDATGLVLADETRVGAQVRQRREAVEVVVDPDFDDEEFALVGEPVHIDSGGGGLRELTADSRAPEATSWELPAPPDGFSHVGRFALSPAGSEVKDVSILVPNTGSVVDVWASGADFLVIDNGGTRNRRDPFEGETAGRRIDLGALGSGRVVAGLRFIEVRAGLEDGRFVRVRGTLSAQRLVEIARSLEPHEGGELTPR